MTEIKDEFPDTREHRLSDNTSRTTWNSTSQASGNGLVSRIVTVKTQEELESEAASLCKTCTTDNDNEKDVFRQGTLLASGYTPSDINLSLEDRKALDKENSDNWKDRYSQPKCLWFVAILCGMSAIVQGMDQSVVNGAQTYYVKDFNITNEWIVGLVNGAPSLCAFALGCWTSAPLNKYTGRRWTIWISCLFAIASGIWQAFTHSTWELFAARLLKGIAIGAKSATTSAYAAECAPPMIRGALGSQWQMWTAFGIMLGFVASVAFGDVHSDSIEGLNWRLMLGSASIPPLFVCALMFAVPESPRWLAGKGKWAKAYASLCKLRNTKVQASRDIYNIHVSLEREREEVPKGWKKKVTQLFSVPRNRRAAQAAFFLMFMQQFCGVNVIAYYSTKIFEDGGFPTKTALLASLAAGLINWLFAIPGVFMIDKSGRRPLLMWTFPMMAACLFFTGFSFWIPEGNARIGCIATGIYLFMIVYSPGMGPVPFTYSGEAFPLAVRDIGMSFATATCWGFNFLLALTWPAQVKAMTPQGGFAWYAVFCLGALVFTYFCLPETKEKELEELDAVFSVRTRDHARYMWHNLSWFSDKKIPDDLQETRAVLEDKKTKRVVETEKEQGALTV